jgi:hypothetical protein
MKFDLTVDTHLSNDESLVVDTNADGACLWSGLV